MKKLAGFALFAAALAFNSGAYAAAVNCPGTPGTGDREFTLNTTPSAVCLASGTSNINGSNDAINNLPPGYVTLDKSDNDIVYGGTLNELTITGAGTTSGTFSFTAPAGFFNFVIALKSGEGVLDPDWAAFSLAAGVTSGTWAISGSQNLSHINLYGQTCEGPCPTGGPGPSPVPLPAPFLLLGLALGGLGAARWLKNRSASRVG